MTESGVYLSPTYGGTEFGGVFLSLRKMTKVIGSIWRLGTPSTLDGTRREMERMKHNSWYATSISISVTHNLTQYHVQTTDQHQLLVENLPDAKGYATSELWVPHPTKSYFWKMCVR